MCLLPTSVRTPAWPEQHFPTMLKFGSRFGMMTKISSEASEKYGSESHAGMPR